MDSVCDCGVDGFKRAYEYWILGAGGRRCSVCRLCCVPMFSSNAMAVIWDEFPHMTGTASSLAGTFRVGIGTIVGALLFLSTLYQSVTDDLVDFALRPTCSILFYLYASRPKKR